MKRLLYFTVAVLVNNLIVINVFFLLSLLLQPILTSSKTPAKFTEANKNCVTQKIFSDQVSKPGNQTQSGHQTGSYGKETEGMT